MLYGYTNKPILSLLLKNNSTIICARRTYVGSSGNSSMIILTFLSSE
jgi:hypothetical protein